MPCTRPGSTGPRAGCCRRFAPARSGSATSSSPPTRPRSWRNAHGSRSRPSTSRLRTRKPSSEPRQLRVLHAPINIAGGPGAISKGLQALGVTSTMLVFQERPFERGFDRNLGLRTGGGRRDLVYNLPRQLRALAWALPHYDVFHFHAGLTITPKKINLPLLRALGKGIVFQSWGSDLRGQ